MSRKRQLGHFNPEMREFVDADYLESLSAEEFEYYRQFVKEYYDGKFTDSPLHTDVKKAASEVGKREYRARFDVFNLSKRRGQLEYLNERPTALEEDVSTPVLDYEEIYKREGYKASLEKITTDAMNQLDEGVVEMKVVFERYYLQRDKLRRLEAADKVAQRDLKRRRRTYGR